MVLQRIENFAVNACWKFIDTGIVLKKGAIVILEEGGEAMFRIYSMDGFEKWSKAIIADMQFIDLFTKTGDVFKDCLETIEAQKDLYYATLFIGTLAEWSKSKTMPDIVKVLQGIGNFCEAGRFLKKKNVFELKMLVKLSTQFGAIKVFSLKGQDWTMFDMPVINNLCDKPKDFFVAIASAIEVKRWLVLVLRPNGATEEEKAANRRTQFEWDVLLKVIGNTGKFILIACPRKYSRTWQIGAINVITQNASLIKFILEHSQARRKRFNYVAAAAAPAA